MMLGVASVCLPCIIPIRQYDAGSGSVDDINVDDAGFGRTVEISLLRSTYSLHDAILRGNLANTCTVEPEVQFRNPLPRAPRPMDWPVRRGSDRCDGSGGRACCVSGIEYPAEHVWKMTSPKLISPRSPMADDDA
jgi:hypothetical protein